MSGRWPARRLTAVAALVALATALGAAACSAGGPGGSGGGGRTTLTVSAAASLTEPFTRIARRYESEHPGVRVRLNVGGSDALAQQVVAGAPVDVFASANRSTMDQVERAGLLRGAARVFARNVLEIAVPPGNPGHVTGLAGLADSRLRLAVCEATVPCGAAARKVFATAGVAARPDTLENDVRAVLTKVELGEVDAGLVYRTDVRSAGSKVEGVEFPEAGGAVNDYYLGTVSGSPDAARFVDFVRSDAGREILTQAGFQEP